MEKHNQRDPRATDPLETDIDTCTPGELRAAYVELRKRLKELATAKEQIEMYERQYMLMLDNIKDHAVFMIDPEGRIMSWNSPAATMFGYMTADVLGKSHTILFTPEDQAEDKPRRILADTLAHGRAKDDSWRVRRDGTRFWTNSITAPMKDTGTGMLLGYVQVLHDMTEDKAIEDARNALFKELQLQVQEGKHTLSGQIAEATETAKRLHEQEEELRDADNKKNQFISILSHELRNPLASILSGAELLQQEKADGVAEGSEERETIDMIVRQTKNIARLLDDLLDISRVLLGKIQLQKKDVDVRILIHRAVETTAALFKERSISIKIDLLENASIIHADPVRVEQIFINILDNAAKYSPENTRVHIRATEEDGMAVIRIKDEGIGIKIEHLPQIFELFTQPDRGRRLPAGLGIGLALAKDLAEMHGGSIEAASQGEGKGSEFVVRLPLLR